MGKHEQDAVPASRPGAIRFEHVDLAFGERPVIADLSLTVGKGEFVCIIGPSGCGKTTALRIAGGLVRPDAGLVEIGNTICLLDGHTVGGAPCEVRERSHQGRPRTTPAGVGEVSPRSLWLGARRSG